MVVVETIENRYTVQVDMLSAYLETKFDRGNFIIIAPDEDAADDKWKIQIPRNLTYGEKVEIQRKFREATHASKASSGVQKRN